MACTDLDRQQPRRLDMLENIEQHLDLFPSDDDLGSFIETNVRWTLEDPAIREDIRGAAVHGALHREWTVFGSPGNLGGTDTSLRNYTFWKLHGWIDDVWSRYRAAKGLTDDDATDRDVYLSECILMYYSRRSTGRTRPLT